MHGLVDDDPAVSGLLIFGARSLTLVERWFTNHLLTAWSAGRSSLRAAVGREPATAVGPGVTAA